MDRVRYLCLATMLTTLLCFVTMGWSSYQTYQQHLLIEDYLLKVENTKERASAQDTRLKLYYQSIYQQLTQDNKTQLVDRLLQLSAESEHAVLEQLLNTFPTPMLVALAEKNHLPSMRYLANSDYKTSDIWHDKLIQNDLIYTWQHARTLAQSAITTEQKLRVLQVYSTALVMLNKEKQHKQSDKQNTKTQLTNEVVQYAINNRAEGWQQLLRDNSTATTQTWQQYFEQYYLSKADWLERLQQFDISANCAKPMILLAQTPWDLHALQQLAKEFLQGALAENFCMQELIWTDALDTLEQQLADIENVYWLVYRPLHKAYRYHQQIHLPTTADIKLLEHEVGHWLGFEDEYALRPALAVLRCTAPRVEQNIWAMGLNIVAVKDGTYFNSIDEAYSKLSPHMPWLPHIAKLQDFMVESQQGWSLKSQSSFGLSSEKVGIYVTNTCDNHYGVTAYKPIVDLSFMYNYEISIPKFYKKHLIGDG